MDLIKREPGAGYLDTWLWLPKSHTSEQRVRSALTYFLRDDAIQAWEEEPHHYRVPRNFIPIDALRRLPYPVYDTRVTSFPRVSFRSKVTLDAKNPDRTIQRDGSKALLDVHDGILSLRCGAGKTVCAIHTAAQTHTPTLVLVNETGLAEQWVDEILRFTDLTEDDVGRLWGSQKFEWEKPLVVATIHTIAGRVADRRLPPEMTRHFGVVLMDESHVMGAPWFNQAIPPFHGRRWGLSATPSREDEFDSLLKYTMGPVVFSYQMPDQLPNVYFRRLPTRLDRRDRDVRRGVCDNWGNFHFGKTYGYLARERPDRTAIIVHEVERALALGREVLILSHSRDMVETLADRFPNGGAIVGGMKSKKQMDVIHNCNPVVAIMQKGKQALNKPSLDTLFQIEPYSKQGVMQQTMGRILRQFDGKKTPVVVFFEDHHIPELQALCSKIRRTLRRWPAEKGGRIPYTVTGDK